ncbi:MAG: MFS transporter [archaeon]
MKNPYKANIWKMYVFKFLSSLHFFGGVLVPFFLDWGGISFTWVMILMSFYLISIFFLEVPTGAVADYLGRKTSLIFAAIATFIGVIFYSIYPSLILFFIAEFFWAMGTALLSGADKALVYDSMKKAKILKKSKKIFARLQTVSLVSIMVAAPIGSLIAATLGLRYAMLLFAVPVFFAALIGLTLKEPKTTKKVESKRYIKVLTSGITYFKKHRVLQMLTFDKAVIYVLVFFLIWLYQPLLTQQNVPIVYFGFILAAILGAEILVLNSFGFWEKLVGGKKRYLMITALLSGVCFIILGFNTIVFITIILFLIIMGFGLTRSVLFDNYMNRYIKSENRATVLSTTEMISNFGSAIAYPLVGLSVEWSLNYTFVIIGVLIIIFALVSRVKEEHLID